MAPILSEAPGPCKIMGGMRGVRTPLEPLGEPASGRRTLDQRLNLRVPALYRAVVGLGAHLPPRSAVRRRLLARTTLLAYAAGNRRDFDVLLLGIASDHEYRPSRELMPPDLPPVFHGHEGYLRLWRYWMDAFEDIRWDPEEIIDFGDRLLVATQQRGHGSGSGVAVSVPVFQVFITRRGMVIRQEDFLDRAEALEAASRGG
jgi:ketosteroid isomerase-like protein